MRKRRYFLARLYKKYGNRILLFLKKKLFRGIDGCMPEVILVHTVGNLGDSICRIPAIYEIRRKYPFAKLILLTSPNYREHPGLKEILEKEKWIDDIIVYYYDEVNSIKSGCRFFYSLRHMNVSYFINLPYDVYRFRTGLKELLWAKLTGARFADGFQISIAPVYLKEQAYYERFPKEVERCLSLLPFSHSNNIKYPIHFTEEEKLSVESAFLENSLENEEVLVISFAGKGEAKRWEDEKFRKIISLWTKKYGSIILTGSASEYENGERMIHGIQKTYNFCGRFTLRESFYLLKKAKRVLSIDTGTGHQAAALGIPAVILMNARDIVNIWEPYGENIHVIRKELPCSPCISKDKKCKYGYPSRCMKGISVKEVWETVEKYLVL